MEKKLAALFDFQHFAQNERLSRMIEATEKRCAKKLPDDLLEGVTAAGSDPTTDQEDPFKKE